MLKQLCFLTVVLLLGACHSSSSQTSTPQTTTETKTIRPADPLPNYDDLTETPSLEEAGFDELYKDFDKAYFASGCFWCTEEVFERVRGVEAVYSGYSGGESANPTYRQIGSGTTGHAEAVVVYYDAEVVSYDLLLEFFYASHDATQVDGQGPDHGTQYRSAVFYLDDIQKNKAESYQAQLEASGKYDKAIATEITAAGNFYLAEAYHQDYYPNHPENMYVQRISVPKVEKFSKAYSEYLKE